MVPNPMFGRHVSDRCAIVLLKSSAVTRDAAEFFLFLEICPIR